MEQQLTQFSLIKRIISFARPFRKSLGIIFLCVVLITLVDALSSWFLSKIFDLVQQHGTNSIHQDQAFLFLGLAMATIFLRIIIVGFRQRIQIKKLDVILQNYLNHESISKFFAFSVGQHINEHSGVKQTIVNNGTASIQNQINVAISQMIPAVAQFFVALAVLFTTNVMIGLIFLGIAFIFCLMMYSFNKMLIPGIRKIRDRKQLNARLMSEVYRLVCFIKNESQEERALVDVSEAQKKHQDLYQEAWLPATRRLQGIRVTTATIRYGALFLVVYLLFNQRLSVGEVFLCFTWSGVFILSLWDITDLHKQFLLDKINIEKYLDLLEVKADVSIAENPLRPDIQGKIEFKNVTFYYPRRKRTYEEDELSDTNQIEPVLKDVTFTIYPGEKIGIVGESGSGKSTLANLLRRGFDPQKGQILIDGNDLRLLDLKYYLEKIGSVEQEVPILDRSIRENILFGLKKPTLIDEKRLKELSTQVKIDGFFDRLEHGFDTIVGERGIKLSGGERQRVGIARALAKEPNILIFDEATSALDSMSEHIVQQSIDAACKGKTAILIAHRLSTVKNCDRILVFRHGVLIDQGTHDELLNSCEYYADLVHHQIVA